MTLVTTPQSPSPAPGPGRGARKRPPRGQRRAGYVAAAVVNALMLYAVNVWPGWDAVPFLTADTTQVLGLVNASIVVTLCVNLLYVVRDPPWLKALGDLATTTVGLLAALRVWDVFPFDLSDTWTTVVRVLLVLAVVGSAIALVVAAVSLARAIASGWTAPPADDASGSDT